jgi:hypothetical protein
VGSRRPVGKVEETHLRFPGLSIGDRACAVRRGSAQPTVHKFTAPARHGVTRPLPSQPAIGQDKPRPVFASRAPDADAADYTSRRTRQGCASVRCRWLPGAGRPRVLSPESAAIATRALNSALRCFRFTPTSHVLWTGQPLAYPAVQSDSISNCGRQPSGVARRLARTPSSP